MGTRLQGCWGSLSSQHQTNPGSEAHWGEGHPLSAGLWTGSMLPSPRVRWISPWGCALQGTERGSPKLGWQHLHLGSKTNPTGTAPFPKLHFPSHECHPSQQQTTNLLR